jgi:hypothetical protein
MTSMLVKRSLLAAGLGPVDEARGNGDLAAVKAARPLLDKADLLPLGALADAIRAREVGSLVHVHLQAPNESLVTVVHADPEGGAAGVTFLRRVAIARITSEPKARIAVDWVEIGLELAQVALGFGASELSGAVVNKRGLPIADGETRKIKGQGNVAFSDIKLRELEGLLARVGRVVTYAGAPAAEPASATVVPGADL